MPNTELTPLARARQAYTFDRGRGTIRTASGGIFTPLDPKPEHVRIADIAHALGQKARFAGHCSNFYSVAEHAVFVSRLVDPSLSLLALNHDDAEAYLPDVASPIKPALAGFDALETRVLLAIFKALNIEWHPTRSEFPHQIKVADHFACAIEKLVFLSKNPDLDAARAMYDLGILEEAGMRRPEGSEIEMWMPCGVDWVHARDRFMWRYMELSGATEADVSQPGRVPFDYGVSMVPESPTTGRIQIGDAIQAIDDPLRLARPGWCW